MLSGILRSSESEEIAGNEPNFKLDRPVLEYLARVWHSPHAMSELPKAYEPTEVE